MFTGAGKFTVATLHVVEIILGHAGLFLCGASGSLL